MKKAGMGYRAIADDLRAAIANGVYRPGSTLPTEHELAARYGANRGTVRRALTELKLEGLLAAATSLGTYVPLPPVQLTVGRYLANLGADGPSTQLGPWETACREHGVTGSTQMLGVTREPATSTLAGHLRVEEGTTLVRRARLMLADDTPAQLQDAWMPAALVEGTPLAEPAKIAVGVYPAMVAAGLRIDHVVETVTARMATRQEQNLLGLPHTVPVLEVWRVTYDDANQPVEVVKVVATGQTSKLLYRLPLRPA